MESENVYVELMDNSWRSVFIKYYWVLLVIGLNKFVW